MIYITLNKYLIENIKIIRREVKVLNSSIEVINAK